MIQITDIYIALREVIEQACADAGITAPVIAGDLTEPIVRPSIKIELTNDQASRDATHMDARSLTARIYYFAPDAHKWRDANYSMQDALRSALHDSLMVGTFEIYSEDGIDFDTTDGVLIGTLQYDWLEDRPSHDDGELIEELSVAINT